MLDSHLHVVDAAHTGADSTTNPAGAWWHRVDASPAAVVARVRAAGVDGAVLVQAVGAHGFNVEVARQAAKVAGPGWVAVSAAGETGAVSLNGVAGLRLFSVPAPARSWIDSERACMLVQACVEADVTPSVCCLRDEIGAVGRLADGFRDVEIAVDHAGFVDVTIDTEALQALAGHENVVVKLSTGVFDLATGSPRQVVNALITAFGTERISWGSDHPQVHDRSYADLVALARTAVAHLPETARDAILHTTTARLWF